MSEKLYRLEDGGAFYWIAAASEQAAIDQWAGLRAEEDGSAGCLGDIAADYGLPDIVVVDDAGSVTVNDEDREITLAEAFRQHKKEPVRHGILCCSEWP